MEIVDRPTAGSTPVDAKQIDGLRIRSIRNQAELDAAEQANILQAMEWMQRARSLAFPALLSMHAMRNVHRRMFGQVYTWAGAMRARELNIGCEPRLIAEKLHHLCEDVKLWTEHGHWPPEETAVRFHHALVLIHVFPNGNGRHARLMADLLLTRRYRLPPMSWGGESLPRTGGLHDEYIAAMRRADVGDFGPIISFATRRR